MGWWVPLAQLARWEPRLEALAQLIRLECRPGPKIHVSLDVRRDSDQLVIENEQRPVVLCVPLLAVAAIDRNCNARADARRTLLEHAARPLRGLARVPPPVAAQQPLEPVHDLARVGPGDLDPHAALRLGEHERELVLSEQQSRLLGRELVLQHCCWNLAADCLHPPDRAAHEAREDTEREEALTNNGLEIGCLSPALNFPSGGEDDERRELGRCAGALERPAGEH